MRPWTPLHSTSPSCALRVADVERRAIDDELARRRVSGGHDSRGVAGGVAAAAADAGSAGT